MTTTICPKCENKFSINTESNESVVICPHCTSEFNVNESSIEDTILAKGTDIGGFEIIRVIGEGSMGIVYLALQKSMNRNIALKVLKNEIVKDTSDVEQFLNEARMTGKLEHPNIVSAIDTGSSDGHYYLAMTFVDGETLEERLERGQNISEKDALKYSIQISDALDYAYSQHQLIHKDIKPSNIMVNEENNAFLLDMGIAQHIGHSEAGNGQIDGSPFYMSPEQARADKLEWTTDQYSLGATLYNLIVGKPPFSSSDVMEILELHKNAEFPMPSELNPDVKISQQTVNLLKKMMQKSPEQRFTSWKDYQKRIKQILSGKKGAGTVINIGTATRTPRTLKKKRSLFATISAVSLILLTVGTASYFAYKTHNTKKNERAFKASQAIEAYWETESKKEKIDYYLAQVRFEQTLMVTRGTKYNEKIQNMYNGIKYEIESSEKIKGNLDSVINEANSSYMTNSTEYRTKLKDIRRYIGLLGTELQNEIIDEKKVDSYKSEINVLKADLDLFNVTEKCNDVKKLILSIQTEDPKVQAQLDKITARVNSFQKSSKIEYDKLFKNIANWDKYRENIEAILEEKLKIEQEKINRIKALDNLIERNRKVLGLNFVKYGRSKNFKSMVESLVLPRTEPTLMADDEESAVKKAQDFDKWNDVVIDYGQSTYNAWNSIVNSDTKFAGVKIKNGIIRNIKSNIVDIDDGSDGLNHEDLRRLSGKELKSIIQKISKTDNKGALGLALALGDFDNAKQMTNTDEEKKIASDVIKGYLYARFSKAKKDGATAMTRLKDEYGHLSEFNELEQ